MSVDLLKNNLDRFKRKYFVNKILKGSLVSGVLFGSILLIISLLEGYFWFSETIRLMLFSLFVLIIGYCLLFQVLAPLLSLVRLRKGISDHQAAHEIGRYFPEIQDKLVNYLQLSELSNSESSLLAAALHQKTNELTIFSFKEAINFRVNLKYFYYLSAVAVFILLVSFINPNLFIDSTTRIIHFSQPYEKPAPFSFHVLSDLVGFQNDNYELKVTLKGNSLPEDVYLVENGRRFRMSANGEELKFNFPALSKDKQFRLEAAGYFSPRYEIKVYPRPEIRDLNIQIKYPKYTGLSDQKTSNVGSLIVPEGSQLHFTLKSSDADKVFFITESDSTSMTSTGDQIYMLSRTALNSFNYELALRNNHARNKSKIAYEIAVTKDQVPEIEANFFPDTVTYQSLLITGSIMDDYGFNQLNLHYKRANADSYRRIPISYDRSLNSQQFIYQWNFDSLQLEDREYLTVYVSVGDNDAINGTKFGYSARFTLRMPSNEEIKSLIESKSENSQNELEKSLQNSEALNKQLKELESRLKNKKEIGWQDQKMLEQLIRDKKKLEKDIEELKLKHQQLLESQKEFGKQSKKLQEKSEQLQNLINEVLDEETKKLYDELQKLLKEESNSEEVLKQLSKIQNKEQNLEKELERALELFKRMKLETQLEQAAQELKELGEKQEKLGEKTQSKPSDENAESLNEQEEINKAFEEIQKDLEEAEQLNEELKSPGPLDDLNKDREEISEKLDEIKDQLSPDEPSESEEENEQGERPENEQNNKERMNSTGQKMKNAGQKMKAAAQKLEDMQAGAEMVMMQENLDNLRDILDNLIKLSFEQERILKDIQEVEQVDPRFIELSQEQLKLMANIEVIEDSLLSLASRVAQISNFVTREVSEINRNLETAMFELRERNKGKATSNQQYAMTSMNNLALLLDDVLSQMQMSMAEAMGKPQSKGQQKQSMPSMSEMQKQLSEQIQQLKQSGKSGRQLSEELARLAAEQEQLRQAMEEMQKNLAGQPGKEGEDGKDGIGNKLKEAIQKMEENETDLVNKRITQQLINRQQDIITRMLEAEESMREQQKSPEREGETASDITRNIPPAVEEYLKARRQEIDLLKTIPLDLNPFYKKEVNDYFRRLSGQQHE
ncbi:DUF4175 family protein [Marinoscillum luteum]|uniref:DUF4175 family protein n=1 Tax=Marinoscillum luteum TaxID=861051 RepID=UPI00375835CF